MKSQSYFRAQITFQLSGEILDTIVYPFKTNTLVKIVKKIISRYERIKRMGEFCCKKDDQVNYVASAQNFFNGHRCQVQDITDFDLHQSHNIFSNSNLIDEEEKAALKKSIYNQDSYFKRRMNEIDPNYQKSTQIFIKINEKINEGNYNGMSDFIKCKFCLREHLPQKECKLSDFNENQPISDLLMILSQYEQNLEQNLQHKSDESILIYFIVKFDPDMEFNKLGNFTQSIAIKREQILNSQEQISLQSCITNTFSPPQNQFINCTACSNKSVSSKTTITKLPRILILLFKRFQYVRGKSSKNDVLVNFPVNQILDADVVFKSASDSSLKKKGGYYKSFYELSSVIYHQGNATGGHYFTRRKNFKGEWVKYDDQNITNEGKFGQKVVNQNAYFLFYRLVDDFL